MPIEKKSASSGEFGGHGDGGRHLDHHAELDLLPTHFATDFFGHFAGAEEIVRRGDHREHQPDRAVLGGAEDRAELGHREVRAGLAEAEAAQAEEG